MFPYCEFICQNSIRHRDLFMLKTVPILHDCQQNTQRVCGRPIGHDNKANVNYLSTGIHQHYIGDAAIDSLNLSYC